MYRRKITADTCCTGKEDCMKRVEREIDGKKVEIRVYSTDRTRTSDDKEMDARARTAVSAVINKAKVCKTPIAKYDNEAKKPYLEYSDGKKVYGD